MRLVRVGYDLNLTQGCHRFYYLAPFAVFDSLSHPFLLCQCLFTFCVVWRINLRSVSQDQRSKMLRNKIKQDFHFTTLKGFKIIKLTTCDRFYNKKNILHLLRCLTPFLISFYRVNICLHWENIECSALLVTNVNIFCNLPLTNVK
jgi:hypothetical protein